MNRSMINSLRSGVTLIEVAISTVLVGVVLVASLETVGSSLRTARSGEGIANAQALAEWLLAEIMAQPYEDSDGTPLFGIEIDETSSPVNRTEFDDTDDYHGWTGSPPQTDQGLDIPDLGGWSRSVSVTRVGETMPIAAQATDIGLRHIVITVTDPEGNTNQIAILRSKHSAMDQAPAVDTTRTTRVAAALTLEGSDTVLRSAANENHAQQP